MTDNNVIQLNREFYATRVSKLYLNERMADVHFVFNNDGDPQQLVPANKSILAASSPVFETMFYGDLKEESDVKIVDATAESFKEFLQFFYFHEVKLTIENIAEVINLLNKYDLADQMNICDEFLMKNLTENDVIMALKLAITFDRKNLKIFCIQKISIWSKRIFLSDAFRQCSRDILKLILQVQAFSCSESQIFDACMNWAENACVKNKVEVSSANCREQLGDCLHLIQFEKMSSNEVQQFMTKHMELFNKSELVELFRMFTSTLKVTSVFQSMNRTYIDDKSFIEYGLYSMNIMRKTENVTYWMRQREELVFQVNKRLLLGALSFDLYSKAEENYKLKGTMTIRKFSLDNNNDDNILLTQTITINCHHKIRMRFKYKLTELVSVEPNTLYEIGFNFSNWRDETFISFKSSLHGVRKEAMRRSRTASGTSCRNTTKNYVKEGAKCSIKKATEKECIPGIYTAHHPSQCDQTLNDRPIHLKREKQTDGKEIVQIITQHSIRDLVVPVPNNKLYPTIWRGNEIKRIKSTAKVLSRNDKLAKIQENEVRKKLLEEESERRKMLMKEIDRMKAEKDKNVNHISECDNVKGRILDRAFVAQQEETEEVKRANRLILATKCHVIRDAQIAEKYEIERVLREEDHRLDKMMLEERDKALKLVDEHGVKQKIYNAKHADEIKQQLQQREIAKLLEAERIEDEAKIIARATVITTAAMEEQERQRKKQKMKIKEEFEKFKELSESFKSIAFEEQRIADMKAQEYMRTKQERDKEVAHAKRLKMEQKQREADALLKLQTKFLETKNEREEMTLRRNQEEKERDFRCKEKEAAIKRKMLERDLELARAAQLKEVQRAKAMEMTRDKIEFDIALEKLMAEEAKEKEKQDRILKDQEKYRAEIINQMKQKENEKREKQRLDHIEFANQQDKEKERNKNIQTIINSKIEGMREAKIPEKFIKDVERQLRPSTILF